MKNSVIAYVFMALFLSYGCTDAKPKEIVLITTSMGDIKVKLYDETPKHKENFLKLADEGYYDSLLFHRVITQFMIQGGDPNSRTAADGSPLGNGGPEYTIPAEFNNALYHKKGALAAARTGDNVNPEKASSGSQFYIVQGKPYTDEELDNVEKRIGGEYTEEQREVYKTAGGVPFLDRNYTVFGEVIEGLDVIDKIAATKTARGDRPEENVYMTMKLVKK